MEDWFVAPVHPAKIQIRCNEADLVANPLSDERGLRIIEDDALLVVEQAGSFVDLSDDRVQAEHGNAIPQNAVRTVERLALPDEHADGVCELRCEDRAGCNNRRTLRRAVRNGSTLRFAEQIVELGLGQLEQARDINRHGMSSSENWLSLLGKTGGDFSRKHGA